MKVIEIRTGENAGKFAVAISNKDRRYYSSSISTSRVWCEEWLLVRTINNAQCAIDNAWAKLEKKAIKEGRASHRSGIKMYRHDGSVNTHYSNQGDLSC